MKVYPQWRWDQGRLAYFQFENLRLIAQALSGLEGIPLDESSVDPLRTKLVEHTGLPFAPKDYKVWRNYKRVFECSFLASSLNGRLVVTDFCKLITREGEIDADEYLGLFLPRFRYPFPAFSEYRKAEVAVYPFCAVLKYLISIFIRDGAASISTEEVFSLLIGNGCTGLESVEHYANLSSTPREGEGDEVRQVREMLIFASQMSILKWHGGRLFLDISKKDYIENHGFDDLVSPAFIELKETRESEFFSVTSLSGAVITPLELDSREVSLDDSFVEGKRSRVTHIKIERSPLLRQLYLKKNPSSVCDMCMKDMKERYSWTKNILEVHHVLPLSSALHITTKGTSLEDVVGICPNCHRSVHAFYKGWLNSHNQADFVSKEEARFVYQEARAKVAE